MGTLRGARSRTCAFGTTRSTPRTPFRICVDGMSYVATPRCLGQLREVDTSPVEQDHVALHSNRSYDSSQRARSSATRGALKRGSAAFESQSPRLASVPAANVLATPRPTEYAPAVISPLPRPHLPVYREAARAYAPFWSLRLHSFASATIGQPLEPLLRPAHSQHQSLAPVPGIPGY